jgi:hypothetical protein
MFILKRFSPIRSVDTDMFAPVAVEVSVAVALLSKLKPSLSSTII